MSALGVVNFVCVLLCAVTSCQPANFQPSVSRDASSDMQDVVYAWPEAETNDLGQLTEASILDGTAPVMDDRSADSTFDDLVRGENLDSSEIIDGAFRNGRPRVATACAVSCALRTNGDVYCWGQGVELNNGGAGEELIRPRQIVGFQDILQFAASCSDACGVDRNYNVWCFGANYGNRLQTGSSVEYLSGARRRLDVSGVAQVATTSNAVLCLMLNGSLYARVTPTDLARFPLPAAAVDLRANSAFGYCVVLATGRVYCWGESGRFADGPRLVEGLDNVQTVAVGLNHRCALKRDGTVWCWGHNEVGQAGIALEASDTCYGGRTTDSLGRLVNTYYYCVNTPRQVPDLTDVIEVSAGASITCVVKRDRTVWCWGSNSIPSGLPRSGPGVIGDGLATMESCPSAPWKYETPAPRPCRRRPSRVVGLSDVVSVSVNDGYACAITATEQLWCWGNNNLGSVGDGTRTSRPTPVRVFWPGEARDE